MLLERMLVFCVVHGERRKRKKNGRKTKKFRVGFKHATEIVWSRECFIELERFGNRAGREDEIGAESAIPDKRKWDDAQKN